MSQTTDTQSSSGSGRAWWQWLLGLSLLGLAAYLGLMRWFPQLQWSRFRPQEIQVSDRLQPADHLPMAPGGLADHNLLIVTFDTTRADRVGCYGNEDVRTYALDRLAAEGALFSKAVAPTPVTLPSHSTIMTGLYPYHHGARANGLYRLDSQHETLAETLARNGYSTAAMVSASVLEEQYGIAQGFQDYDDETEQLAETVLEGVADRSGDKTVDLAEEWLESHAEEKFFLWVHLYDPHFPHEAPAPYSEKYNPYDAEIAFADAQLSRLIQLLEELEIDGKTLVVVAGDHGEGLGQHDESTHSCLVYDSTLHVPLIMWCGDQLGGGLHLDRLVSLADIMPTVLSMLGITPSTEMDGIDLTQPPPDSRVVFFETLQGLQDHGWAALLGVRRDDTKLIHGPRSELFDVAEDPFELEDLSDQQPEVAAELKERLVSFFGDDLEKASSATPTHQLDAAEIAKLQSLGYLQDVGSAAVPPSERPHPRDMMKRMAPVYVAAHLEESEGLEAAIEALSKIVAKNPDLYRARLLLGRALAKHGDLESAELEFDECIRLRPGISEPIMQLGPVLVAQKRGDEAMGLYREWLMQNPADFRVGKRLGELLLARGQYREAVPVMTQALTLSPRDETLPDALANASVRIGTADDVATTFLDLLEVRADLPAVRNALSRIEVGRGNHDAAVQLIREGIAESPQRRDLVNNLALLLVSHPDPTKNLPVEAAVILERVCYETRYQDPRFMHTLAAVYAAQARIDEAIAMATKAQQVAGASDRPEHAAMVAPIGLSLDQYRMLKEQGVSPPETIQETEPSSGPPASSEGSLTP